VTDESFEETFSRLRLRYLEKARARCDGFVAVLERLESTEADGEALDEIRQSFHKLSGSGATYGFPRVSEIGLQGELACDAIRKRAGLVRCDDVDALRQLVDALRREFDE
jgi:chemotaxis protein histidine kinase CheA